MVILPTVSAVLPAAFGATAEYGAVRQITFGAYHHVLTNANVWSPDGSRIVYDLRSPGRFDGERIEDVDVLSGNRRILYQSRNGAHCGVATYCHTRERIVFILGPENPTPDWSYGFSRRRGVVVATDAPSEIRPLDAMNYRPPFAPGALRGGSHLHVFSPDGKWVSFTYDDELLARLDASSTTAGHEPNQRNIGIAVPWGPVQVAKNFPRNHDGDWFSVLVTRTAANPKPGSEEISRASEEAWVGTAGYIRPDGTRQQRALAFQGEVAAPDGSKHSEVFIVDLPDDLTVVGEEPLAGTPTTRPAPPKGVFQRRLTYTSESRYPGLAAVPRHWLRSTCGSPLAHLWRFLGHPAVAKAPWCGCLQDSTRQPRALFTGRATSNSPAYSRTHVSSRGARCSKTPRSRLSSRGLTSPRDDARRSTHSRRSAWQMPRVVTLPSFPAE